MVFEHACYRSTTYQRVIINKGVARRQRCDGCTWLLGVRRLDSTGNSPFRGGRICFAQREAVTDTNIDTAVWSQLERLRRNEAAKAATASIPNHNLYILHRLVIPAVESKNSKLLESGPASSWTGSPTGRGFASGCNAKTARFFRPIFISTAEKRLS
jgi:hypothetical protein